MTIEEVYSAASGNFQTVLNRFGTKELVERFARKFLEDDSYPQLVEKLAEKDVQESFRAAHTLKGVCMNLGFDGLLAPVKEITEILRAGSLEGTAPLMKQITEEYTKVCDAVRQLDK